MIRLADVRPHGRARRRTPPVAEASRALDDARRERDGAKRALQKARRRFELAGTGTERLTWRGAAATRAALLAQAELRVRELEARTLLDR